MLGVRQTLGQSPAVTMSDVRTANLTVPSQLCPVSLLPSLPPSVSSCLSSASMWTFKIVFRKASLEAGPSTPGNVVRAAFSYGL